MSFLAAEGIVGAAEGLYALGTFIAPSVGQLSQHIFGGFSTPDAGAPKMGTPAAAQTLYSDQIARGKPFAETSAPVGERGRGPLSLSGRQIFAIGAGGGLGFALATRGLNLQTPLGTLNIGLLPSQLGSAAPTDTQSLFQSSTWIIIAALLIFAFVIARRKK